MSAANVRAMELYENGKLQAVEDGREAAKRPEVVRLPLDKLTAGPKVRRERHDLDHVRALMERGQWPPVLVTAELTPGGCHRIIDGHHRHAAANRLGHIAIEAILFEGDAAEVLEQAVKANVDHGLPLTIQERQSLASRFIKETDWSDRRIAQACGLSHPTVGKLRPRASGNDYQSRGQQVAEGREEAADQIRSNPEASDREVAKRTGLSPHTVADVRRRNAEGKDPVPNKLREAAEPAPEPEKAKLQAVPDPEPQAEEPSVSDILTLVPTEWGNEPACQRSNATREFGRFMDRFTTWHSKGFQAWVEEVGDNCPAELRTAAANQASWMASWWFAYAEQLNTGKSPLGEA